MTALEKVRIWWRQSQAISASFGGQVLVTMGTNLGLALLALVTGSLAARLLGPQGRGELAAIQTWPGFVALVASLGMPDAVVYFSSRFRQRSGEYLASAVALSLLSALPFVVIGYLSMPLLLAAQSPGVITAARWYLIFFLPLQATQGMLLHPLRGRNDFVLWNVLRLLYMLGWLAALLAAGLLGEPTPISVASAYLVSLALVAVIVSLVIRRRVPGPFAVRRQLWSPMLRFGLPSAASALPQILNLRLDQMLMAVFFAGKPLGYYAIAVSWSSATAPIANAIGAVLFPQVALHASGPEQIHALARGTRLGSILAMGLTVPLLVVTPFGVRVLFGPEFAPAIPAALILVVAGAALGMNMIVEEGLRGLGIPKAVMLAEGVGVIMTIVALGALLRPWNIVGAALASLLGYLATAISLIVQLCRETRQSAAFYLWPKSEDWTSALGRIRTVLGR